jgi:hypothetical protein
VKWRSLAKFASLIARSRVKSGKTARKMYSPPLPEQAKGEVQMNFKMRSLKYVGLLVAGGALLQTAGCSITNLLNQLLKVFTGGA